jgi:YegS/Rv2252/BmrU family lipid kinase
MQVQVIHNPVAGQHDMRKAVDDAVAYLSAQGCDVTLCQTLGEGDAITYAREAVSQRCDMVIAAGGDGTVGQVVNGIVGSECILGVLPIGTANVWARTLGLPLWSHGRPGTSLVDAAKMLMAGEVHRIDLGKCTQQDGRESYFILWSGIGFDAQVTREVEPHREIRRNLGNITYYVAMFALGLTLRGTRLTMVVDGKAVRQRAFMIVVSNVQLYGGSVMVAPQAQLDDGYLDMYVFKGSDMLDAARQLANVFAGKHLQDPTIEAYRARSVVIRAERPLPLQIDGEPSGYTPVSISVLPKALRVMMPSSASPSLFEAGMPEEAAQEDGPSALPPSRARLLTDGWIAKSKSLYDQWGQRLHLPPRE